jgi:hypothetical protein
LGGILLEKQHESMVFRAEFLKEKLTYHAGFPLCEDFPWGDIQRIICM